MWAVLYRLASPRYFFYQTRWPLNLIGLVALVSLIIGLMLGLIFSPPDYQQGDAVRMMYVHVPAAFLSLSLYAFMAFCAILLLVWQIKLAGIMLSAAAKTGASMALIALVTGSLWGKPMWGTWWVWDARLTAELILLLLYLAVLVTHSAFKHQASGDKIIAILILVGSIDLPIIHYSVYWWNTLHQGATLTVFAKPKIAPVMLYPLLFMLLGFASSCVWLIGHNARIDILWRERKQRWVNEYMVENT